MPRIVEYTSKETLDAGGFASLAQSQGYYGRSAASAIERGVGDVTRGITEFGRYQAQNEISRMSSQFADLNARMISTYDKARDAADPNDPEFVANFLSTVLEPELDKIGGGLLTGEAGQYYQDMRERVRAHFLERGVADQSNLAGKAAIDNAQGAINSYANSAALDPTSTQSSADLFVSSVGPTLPAENRAAVLRAGIERIYASGIDGLVTTLERPGMTAEDVARVKMILSAPESGFVSLSPPGAYAEGLRRVESAGQTLAAAESYGLKLQLPDMLARMRQTGADVGGTVAAAGAALAGSSPRETVELRAKFERDYVAALSAGKASAWTRDAPAPEIASAITELSAKIATASPDELNRLTEARDAVMDAVAARDKAFKADPAGFVLENNLVITAKREAALESRDPAQFQQYLIALAAEQQRLYPGVVPALVNDEDANNLGAAIGTMARDEQGAVAVGARLAEMSRLYGRSWTQAASEFMKRKVLSSDQYVAAVLYARPQAQSLAEQILKASVLSDTDLSRLHNVSRDKAADASRAAFEDFTASVMNRSDGPELATAYRDALTRLVMFRGVDAVSDVGEIDDLAADLLTDSFTFSGTLRIPNAPGVDAGKIERGVEATQAGLESRDLVIPDGFGGLPEGAQREEYLVRLLFAGQWFTNETNTGAILYDEQGHPVTERVGEELREVELSWEELQKLGGENLTWTDRVGRWMSRQPQ